MLVEDRNARPKFDPYVAPTDIRPEFTFRAVAIGGIFGILFGAITVYVGLRGLTIAASIPISVLSVSLLRVAWKASVLENNIIQTTGSAGESVASGVIFTLPALIFLGFEIEYMRIFLLAVIGGFLGVLFVIPLRRRLTVEEQNELLYPEGTACADVLIAGDRGGSIARRVFWGFGLGALYTLFQNANIFAAWPSTPTYIPKWLPGAALRANTAPEYLGVGYLIGPRIAGIILSGSVFAWLVLMPAIEFFGSEQTIFPGTMSIVGMSADELRRLYIDPIGVGAVATAALITLVRTVPTIVSVTRARFRALASRVEERPRTEQDIGMRWAFAGVCALTLTTWIVFTFYPVSGEHTSMLSNALGTVLVIVFGFLFVTASSRITGLVGSSSNPISGMAIATLMATGALFYVMGWTRPAFFALGLSVGTVVCIASANAGNTAQDLKTGVLLGATPAMQQRALLVGVAVSVMMIGATLKAVNSGLEEFRPANHPELRLDLKHLPDGVTLDTHSGFDREAVQVILSTPDESHTRTESRTVSGMVLLNAINSSKLPDGQYFLNPDTGRIELRWIQGIGSAQAPAPQARMMAKVINGVLTRKLPLKLVMLGVFTVVAIELLGIQSLPFAVGFYIPIATTLAIFCGGVVRWLVERGAAGAGEEVKETEVSPGSLYASGLIAAGGIFGLMGIIIKLLTVRGWVPQDVISWGPGIPFLREANWLSILAFVVLALSLFLFARKPLEGERQ